MNSRKVVQIILSIIAILLGAFWVLQGVGILNVALFSASQIVPALRVALSFGAQLERWVSSSAASQLLSQ
jgi:predicted RND superfamily exporter protein